MSAAQARRSALMLALDLGILGDYLLRAEGEPGLNLSLLAAAGVIAVAVLRYRRGGLPRGTTVLLAGALLFAVAIAGRAAPALRVFNLLVAAGLAMLAGGAAAGAWLRHAGVADYLAAGFRSALAALCGPAPLVRAEPELLRSPSWSGPVLGALRGALIALPLLLVFGGLLAAADPVFDVLAGDVLAIDPGTVLGHAAVIGLLAWGSAGYLARFIPDAPVQAPGLPLPRPNVGVVEGAVAFGLLNALFLAFVAVQLRYLFGGAELVRVTPGLSYADYARRGFFELVAVAALVIPVQLLADWSVRRERTGERWLFRGLALGQLLLVFAILASALQRMRIYWQTYGLTEQRLYATTAMLWVAFVLAWLGATVLRGRRDRFAFGALAAGAAALLALNVLSPQAFIARVNAGRAAVGAAYDVVYAGQLSGDAVPALVRSLERLPQGERCHVAGQLLERWSKPRPGGWRTLNYGDWQARRTVAAARPELEAVQCAAGAVRPTGAVTQPTG